MGVVTLTCDVRKTTQSTRFKPQKQQLSKRRMLQAGGIGFVWRYGGRLAGAEK